MTQKPTFELDDKIAKLSYSDFPEQRGALMLPWIDYPANFATFMNLSQPDHIAITRLRLVEKEN